MSNHPSSPQASQASAAHATPDAASPHLFINDQRVSLSAVDTNMTLLRFLRDQCGLTGTKEGCAEGDCGACTVVAYEPVSPTLDKATYRALNSCLLLVHALHGRRIYTVEGLVARRPESVKGHGIGLGSEHQSPEHLVQRALVDRLGSQCGYCTPGIVMSLVEACYRDDLEEPWQLDDQMCGNLCRCTGYRPIQETAEAVAGQRPAGPLLDRLVQPEEPQERAERGRVSRVAQVKQNAQGEQSPQSFARPVDLPSLWRAWEDAPTAELIAGGTDLALRLTKRFESIPHLISIDQVRELRTLSDLDSGAWLIGAATPLSDLEQRARDRYPALERMLRFFGARQIKNRGTLGGNLCTASPIGDLAPVLLALGARLHLASPSGARVVSIDEFFLGYRQTCLGARELLVAVELPSRASDLTAPLIERAYKVSKRQELDISSVSAAFSVQLNASSDGAFTVKEARLAYGGMAATPARARHAEAALLNGVWSAELIERAAEALARDFTPITDHRASAWYRGEVAANLLRGFWIEAQTPDTERLPSRPSGTINLNAATTAEETRA